MSKSESENNNIPGGRDMGNAGFSRWRLGSVTGVFARVSIAISNTLRNPRFVEVSFGREETISWANREPEQLSFQAPREMRELRARCRTVAVSGVPLVRAQAAAEPGTVRLDFMFPAAVNELEYSVPLIFEDEIVRKIKHSADKLARSSLLQELVIETRGGRFLVCQAPDFLGQVELTDIISLAHPSGWWLVCRIVASPEGQLYLHVTDAQEPRKDRPFEERRIHFIRLRDGIHELSELTHIATNDVEKLRFSSSPLLKRWAVYRGILTEERTRILSQRLSQTLIYQQPRPDGTKFRVRIANWPSAAAAWCDDSKVQKRSVKLNVPVVIAPTGDSLTEGRNGTIESITPEGEALLNMEAGGTPPEQGCIAARDGGDVSGKRQRKAIERLQIGNVALPTLLDILNDPESAASAERREIKTHRGSFNESQLAAIGSALGNESIVAIQGPPGTGKTEVIVEIIKRLWRRRSRKGDVPMRILISSTQNEAVRNATDKLMKEGLIIHTILSEEAKEKEASKGRAREQLEAAESIRCRVSANIDECVDLKKQCFFGDAIVETRRKFIGWPDNIDDAVARIRELLTDGAIPNGAMEALRSLLSDGQRLIARADEIAPFLINPEKNVSLDQTIPQLQCFLEVEADTLDVVGFKATLQKNEAILREAGLAHWSETASEFAKSAQRACRDGDSVSAASHLIALRQHLGSVSLAKGILVDGPGSLRQELEADIAVWHNRCVMCLEASEGDFALCRAGVLSTWIRALQEEPGLWDELRARYAQVTGATLQMSAPDLRDEIIEYYDYVIIDEAARSDLGDLLIPLTLGRRILLVGDQKQLPPFVETSVARKMETGEPCAAALLVEHTLFSDLFDRLPEKNRIMLNVQYRCHPHIGDAISRAFYDGELHSGSELREGDAYENWLKEKIPYWDLCDNRPLVWIDSGLRSPQVRSEANPIETKIAMDLVRQAIDAQAVKPTRPFLGLIAFYGAQVEDLKRSLAEVIPDYNDWLEIGTVDSFQGKQYPLVILCCSNHDSQGRVGFLALPNRVNVAISRPQRQLIIIGSRSTLLHEENGSPPFKKFESAAGKNLFDGNKSINV